MLRKYIIISFLLLFISTICFPQEIQNVLVLNSYSKGYKWGDDITRGIEDVFRNSNIEAELLIEYMGTKRLSDDKYYNQLFDIYKRKYNKTKIDMIIVQDDNAFNFMKTYRERLYPNIPLVFCGVSYYDPELNNNVKNFTGVSEEVDIKATISLALDIHPKTKNIYIIHDKTTSGNILHKHIKTITDDYPNQKFYYLTNYSMKDLCTKVSELSDDSIIIYAFFFKDINNEFFEYDVSIEKISKLVKVPIYGAWDFSLGHGIIGGKLASGYYQGETAAIIATKILAGVDINNFPVVMESPNKYIFDYTKLLQYDIAIEDLPKTSKFINEPKSFYTQNEELVLAILSVFFALLVFILFLTIKLARKRHVAKIMQKLNCELEGKIEIRTAEISSVNSQLVLELDERKKIEIELRDRKEFIETVLDNLPIGFVVKNLDKRKVTYINKKFKEIVGWPEEVLQDTRLLLRKAFPEKKYRDQMIPFLFQGRANFEKKGALRNIKVIREDEEARFVDAKNIEIPEQYLEILTIQDETAKNIVQNELKEQKDLLSNVLSTIPDYVYWKDIYSFYYGCNESFAKLAGLENPDDIIGKTDYDLNLNSDFKNFIFKNDDIVIKDKIPYRNIESKNILKNGEAKYYSSSGVPLYNAKNKPVGVLGIFSDITKQKLAQQEKDLMEIELRQSQKLDSIGQLAAGIAHEMNTPIQFVSDNTHFIKDAFSDLIILSDKFAEVIKAKDKNECIENKLSDISKSIEKIGLEFINEEVPLALDQSLEGLKRVAEIIKAMKAFSHQGLQSKSNLDINKAIEDTIIVSKNEWKYVANLETDFDPNLPLVSCLPSQISQVLLNILINASHAIEEKEEEGNRGTITIATQQTEKTVLIKIKDSGKGIPEEVKTKIFDPFFTTKEVGKGTGQGLSIAHDIIVNKHQGSISFDSNINSGTTFTIALPIE